jgi:nucleotide-binding universal stress UspA family protein
MPMKDYRTIVVGTDGSELAGPVVARAAWLAVRDDADLVIVCAFAQMPRRTEAMNVATLGGDPRSGQVLGKEAAARAVESAMSTARGEGATVSATLLVEGEPSTALIATAQERSADLVVLGAIHDRSLADRLLGTVATEVTKRATCDVLVVRPADDLGDLEVPEDAPQV